MSHLNGRAARFWLDRNDEALASYNKALSITPDFRFTNRALRCTNSVGTRKRWRVIRALAIKPDFADTHFHYAYAAASRPVPRGWQKYQWRLKTADCSNNREFSALGARK
jgi:hypothetical protein